MVASYLEERVLPLQQAILNPSRRERCLQGLFLRSLAWLKTLSKCDSPIDFQAVEAGTRALLESTIDIVLLHSDKGQVSTERFLAWGESARLKQAQELLKSYQQRDTPVPREHKPIETWCDMNRQRVQSSRDKLWGGRHPNRWTNNNLEKDAKGADKVAAPAIVEYLGMSLHEFYQSEYRRICWSVHGSGLASVWGIPKDTFVIAYALGCKWSADLGLVSSLVLLADSGLAEHLDLGNELRKVTAARCHA